ncbi:hypothetical protein IJJ18_01830 [Candidatus Saccharibacteria bacterium]|nr:hypothetical protein [Candidatus Saccharibacteria bacterium]
MKIVRHIKVDDALFTGSIVIDQSTRNEAADPVVEIFVSVRNRYKNDFCISIYPTSRNALGWAYTLIPANNDDDGDEDIAEKFQDYLENKIGPEFEQKLEQFFADPDGYAAYKVCVDEAEYEAANKVIKNFIYRSASAEDRKKLDRKAKNKRKAAEKAARDRERHENMLKSLGVPAGFRALLL